MVRKKYEYELVFRVIIVVGRKTDKRFAEMNWKQFVSIFIAINDTR